MEASQHPGSPSLSGSRCEDFCPQAADLIHLQKLENLGLVAGQVAHELNNALAIILGHAELTIDAGKDSDGSVAMRFSDIRDAVVHAAALCRGMLAYAGRAEPARMGVDLTELVAQMQRLLQTIAPPPSRIEFQVAPDLPLLMGDPGHLRQILLNLIFNAVEALAGQPGQVRMEVESAPALGCTDTAASSICIRVSDTGCGMDPESLKNLFVPFYSTKAPGRGLGLTAVRALVETMNGTIRAASVPGQGTTFILSFPVHHPEAVSSEPAQAVFPDAKPGWIGTGTVLLVDDEPELLTVGNAILTQAGLCVLTAADGHEAVECFRQNAGAIDLVFLDAAMPGIDGCQALERIREIDPGARVIIISGLSEFDLKGRWPGARPNDILLKPVSPRQLRHTAMRHLANREPALAGGMDPVRAEKCNP